MSDSPTPALSAPARPLVIVFFVMLALTLWFTTRAWHASILDRHNFRQTQTAISAYWIKASGFHLDYETPIFGPPWSVPFEFPIYQWCVATVSRMLDIGLESAGRGVSLFFFLATLPAVYGLAGLLNLAPSRRLLVVSAVLASPTYLYYARTFMIETAALCWAVWFLYTVTRAVRDNSRVFAILAALFAILAGLTKITTFIVFLSPAALLTWIHWRPRWSVRTARPAEFWRATLCAVVPVVCGIGISYWWVKHTDHLKLTNPFSASLVSTRLASWNWGSWQQRVSSAFWLENWSNISTLVLGTIPLTVALIGATLVAPSYRRAATWGAIFFLTGPLLFSNLYYMHDYYYCATAVFLLGGAGFVLAGIWDSVRLTMAAKWLTLVLFLGGQLFAYYQNYGAYLRLEQPAPPAITAVIRAVMPPENVLVVYGWDWSTQIAYYAERRAIMVPQGREPDSEALDAIVRRLPSKKIGALLIRNNTAQRATPAFIRERLNHFRLAPAPFATSADGDLYLADEQISSAAAKLKGLTFPSVTLNTQPAIDLFADQLHDTDLSGTDLSLFSPRPVSARSLLGISLGTERGRPVVLAHAVSELHFIPPHGATTIVAEVGLADGAFAPNNASPSDGIGVEIFELLPNGLRRTLFRRDLDPAQVPEDRGPQTVRLDDAGPFTGTLVFKITPGPKNNINTDWAYWGRIEIR